jgi:hypothetical protein
MGAGNSVKSGTFGRNGCGEPLDRARAMKIRRLLGAGNYLRGLGPRPSLASERASPAKSLRRQALRAIYRFERITEPEVVEPPSSGLHDTLGRRCCTASPDRQALVVTGCNTVNTQPSAVNTRSPLRKLGAGNSVKSGYSAGMGAGNPLRKGYENTALIGRGELLARPGR